MVDDLYNGVLREHYEAPRNHGPVVDAGVVARASNPLCGDEVVLYLRTESGSVTAAGFDGHLCAVSMASASLLTDVAKGRTAAQLLRLRARVQTMLQGDDRTHLGALEALRAVRRYRLRVRCALLPWEALRTACEAWQEREGGRPDRGRSSPAR